MATANLPPSPPRRRTLSSRLTILATLALVLGPMSVFSFVPGEIARWHAAAAQDAAWSQDHDTAVAQLGRAIAWQPENVDWYLLRAEEHRLAGRRDEAIVDLHRARELGGDEGRVLFQSSTIALELGLFDEAIADSRKLLTVAEEQGLGPSAHLQNQLAYFLAVTDRDLEEALILANQALTRLPQDPGILDTRGFIFYRQAQYAEARKDLDQAVMLMKPSLQDEQAKARAMSVDVRQWKRVQQRMHRQEAVILYHRALVLEKLGLEVEAAFDRARVRELGFTPDESLF